MRVSSREAYVAPDRGAQGNALKTIVAMPFVLDGGQGVIELDAGGTWPTNLPGASAAIDAGWWTGRRDAKTRTTCW